MQLPDNPIGQSRIANRNQESLRAHPLNVFPTLGSLQEVIDLAESKMPITDKNEMRSLLMTYHNSLLKVLNDEKNQKP
jgi:hypothetical protein